ncbi:MAG: ABC transporter permease [Anaerolineae bacterium]|nr:ABC transporter permease [Anaerolineae bacterium]
MRQIIAVYKRELGLYFRSPVAYAIAFALMLFFGLLFSNSVNSANGQAPADGVNFVPNLLTFLLFLVGPLLTMRLLAEETREGTLEVLMTLPMKESQFIIGKFFAVWTYYTIVLLLTVIYHIILTDVGVPDMGRAFTMYLGAWLYGGAVLAITMIWSAVTEDQIVAAFLGAATVLVLYLAEVAAAWVASLPNQSDVSGLTNFVREIGLQAHYEATLLQGIIRAEDILYFVFMIIAALFITTRIVEVRRWRS